VADRDDTADGADDEEDEDDLERELDEFDPEELFEDDNVPATRAQHQGAAATTGKGQAAFARECDIAWLGLDANDSLLSRVAAGGSGDAAIMKEISDFNLSGYNSLPLSRTLLSADMAC
jgi:hypothetical protein